METDLDSDGTALYYRTRGNGPILLLLPGGDGDADTYDRLADHLATDFTVATFDRRGLSRSGDAGPPSNISTHADDAAQILRTLSDTPAAVFGSSIGAVIALELLTRHPDVVRLAVVHEPPAAALLSEPERSELATAQYEIEQAHVADGVPAAMALFARLAGLAVVDREPDVDLPGPSPYRAANLEYFLTHDAPAVRTYRPDTAALRARSSSIIPAAGATTTGVIALTAPALAGLLEVSVARFPGGHTGPRMYPRAYAEGLRELFQA